jgi:cyclic-di-GMP-binding protein
MSQVYRRLREGLPEPAVNSAGRFHADAKKVRAWVAALPRANATATQSELDMALASLAGQKLEGSQRMLVLDELRPVVMESIKLLRQQYVGHPLPLPPAKAQLAQHAEMFHSWLGHGYRKAAVELCAPNGAIPMLRGAWVLQTLQRAAWHYVRALDLSWRIYRAPSPGVWQGFHRVHRFATELKIESKSIEDKLINAQFDIQTLYIQSLLMAVSNPLAFSQTEQDSLWALTSAFTARCPLLSEPPTENSPVVPEDADRGPGPGVSGESHTLWLDLRDFARETDRALETQRDGYGEIVPGRGLGVKLSVDMLTRLKRAFGLSAARTYKRLQASHPLDTVIGLTGIHYHLAGQRDFDTFMRQAAQQHDVHVIDRASWVGVNADLTSQKAPRIPARILDQSLGGYRMSWENANQIRVKVGELVAMTLSVENEESEWMLGVVRWLRYEISGGLSAGVELLTRCASAVAVKTISHDRSSTLPQRGVAMIGLDDQEDRSFLTAAMWDSNALNVELIHEAQAYALKQQALSETWVAVQDIMINAGDYAVFRPLRADSITATPVDMSELA